jgi:glycyl-tRNA synthetase beta chain
VDALARLKALQAVRGSENFASLAAAFKMVRNILEKSAGAVRGTKGTGAGPQGDLFREDAERGLYEEGQRIGRAASAHRAEKKYKEALDEIAQLRPAVDLFFDKVLVMAPDAEVRRNRFALLANLLEEFSSIADLSEITVEDASKK